MQGQTKMCGCALFCPPISKLSKRQLLNFQEIRETYLSTALCALSFSAIITILSVGRNKKCLIININKY